MLVGYWTACVIVHTCKTPQPHIHSSLLLNHHTNMFPEQHWKTLHMPLFHSPIKSVILKMIGLQNNRCFCNNSFQRAAKKSVFQRCGSVPSTAPCQPRKKLFLSSIQTWHGNATALPEANPHGPSPLALWSCQLDGMVGHRRLLMRPRWCIRTTVGGGGGVSAFGSEPGLQTSHLTSLW